ncbi:MAG: RNA polymerase sigma factor [bacterium]
MKRPVHSLQTGDADMYGRLFDRVGPALLRLASGILLDSREAEDVLQEAFLRLLKTAREGRLSGGEDCAVGFLRTIARNLAIDRLRKRKVRNDAQSASVHQMESNSETPLAWSEHRELEERLLSLMGNLSALQRVVFLLRALEGLANREIAESLGIGIEDVKTHLKRTRAKLRPLLQDFEELS